MKLNLGCGPNKLDGYVNVDKFATFQPDVVWDLERTPWPFEDNSASVIMAHHCLEHMGADTETFFAIIKELYRVSAPGAQIAIAVPHPRSDAYLGDPTHVRPITPQVMSLFSRSYNDDCQRQGWPNTPLAYYLGVDFEMVASENAIFPRWMDRLTSGAITREQLDEAVDCYFNVVVEVKILLRAVKPG